MSERADEHIQDVPALRFREGGMAPAGGTRIAEYKVLENTDKARTLAEPWKRERLGTMGVPYNGLSGKCKSDFGHGLGRYVTYMNVFSNPIADSIQCDAIEIDGGQNEVKDGDVFFTTSSETPEEVGMSSVWIGEGKNTYLNSFCFGYRPKPGMASEFLAYMFRANGFRGAISFLAQGISRYNISKTKVMDIEISLPDVQEQRKIGSFFCSLDALIDGREKAIGKLESLKKAMLEKMFPQGVAKIPEVRFKGFTGEWEKSSFDEMFIHIPSKAFQIQSTDYRESGQFPVVDQGKVRIVGYTDNAGKVFKAKDNPVIVFGDHTREVKFVDFDFVVGADGTQLLRTPENDIQFMSYVVQSTPLPNMGYSRHFKFLQEATFLAPTLPEQQKIGTYFRSLDALLAARREEVEKLKQMKKAFLERMFV